MVLVQTADSPPGGTASAPERVAGPFEFNAGPFADTAPALSFARALIATPGIQVVRQPQWHRRANGIQVTVQLNAADRETARRAVTAIAIRAGADVESADRPPNPEEPSEASHTLLVRAGPFSTALDASLFARGLRRLDSAPIVGRPELQSGDSVYFVVARVSPPDPAAGRKAIEALADQSGVPVTVNADRPEPQPASQVEPPSYRLNAGPFASTDAAARFARGLRAHAGLEFAEQPRLGRVESGMMLVARVTTHDRLVAREVVRQWATQNNVRVFSDLFADPAKQSASAGDSGPAIPRSEERVEKATGSSDPPGEQIMGVTLAPFATARLAAIFARKIESAGNIGSVNKMHVMQLESGFAVSALITTPDQQATTEALNTLASTSKVQVFDGFVEPEDVAQATPRRLRTESSPRDPNGGFLTPGKSGEKRAPPRPFYKPKEMAPDVPRSANPRTPPPKAPPQPEKAPVGGAPANRVPPKKMATQPEKAAFASPGKKVPPKKHVEPKEGETGAATAADGGDAATTKAPERVKDGGAEAAKKPGASRILIPFGSPDPVAEPEITTYVSRRVALAGKALNVALVASTLLAILVFAVTLIPTMLGLRTMIVTSGSMEPTIKVGDAVLIRPAVPDDSIKVGDVITFNDGIAGGMNTHRVLMIKDIKGRTHFQTQGDNNPTPDVNLVPAEAVFGKVRMTLPKMGFILNFISTSQGKLFLLVLPLLIMMVKEIQSLIASGKRPENDLRDMDVEPPTPMYPAGGPDAEKYGYAA